MTPVCDPCPQERVHELQYHTLCEGLDEVKGRVARLEVTLARGVLLLVANLAGMLLTLAREFLDRA